MIVIYLGEPGMRIKDDIVKFMDRAIREELNEFEYDFCEWDSIRRICVLDSDLGRTDTTRALTEMFLDVINGGSIIDSMGNVKNIGN